MDELIEQYYKDLIALGQVEDSLQSARIEGVEDQEIQDVNSLNQYINTSTNFAPQEDVDAINKYQTLIDDKYVEDSESDLRTIYDSLANAEVTQNNEMSNVTPQPDIPEQTKPSDSLLTAAKDKIKKGKLDKPELYYAMSMGQNLGATISNLLQDSQPVMSLQKNYLKRQKMDPTIYRNTMEDIKEGVAMQTRKLREGAGQMSDFIKGTAATGVGLNRAIQKLGEQARQDLARTTAMNTQIANQELSGLSETLNKEKLFNYQQKQQFAAQKQATLSNNMSNMNKIMRGYADYQYKKDKMNKQQQYMKDYVERQDKMNAIKTALDYQQQIK